MKRVDRGPAANDELNFGDELRLRLAAQKRGEAMRFKDYGSAAGSFSLLSKFDYVVLLLFLIVLYFVVKG